MQFLNISKNTRLSELIQLAGRDATAKMLSANSLNWAPNIGDQFFQKCNEISSTADDVSPQRKLALLNTVTSDSDIFETVALMDQFGWKVFSELGALPGSMRVPDSVTLADSVNILGNGQHVASTIYSKVVTAVSQPPHEVDPSIFNEYSTMNINTLEYNVQTGTGDPFNAFHLPWGDISLFSSLANYSMDFPVYPEELTDGVKANYTTMPDMLYQYEPWQLYQSSGPRSIPFTFHMHRDMWTGDHRDGKCNQLIRFCEANCYPEYNGSAVNTSTVTLYVKGKALISGILTEAVPEWSGPIGLDGFYLDCTLKITITEVSTEPLNFRSVLNKGLIS